MIFKPFQFKYPSEGRREREVNSELAVREVLCVQHVPEAVKIKTLAWSRDTFLKVEQHAF